MKVLVAGLGVLIVLGTALVIGVVVKRAFKSTATSSTATSGPVAHIPGEPAPLPFSTALSAGAGAAIGGIAASGGRVAIWVRTGQGGKVVFVDPEDGAVAGTVTLGP
ncbi:MAG TPA: hypothetical protein VF286_10080 [Acidiphilium sp.]